MSSVTHVAATTFGIGPRLLQRCGVCGEKLTDVDATRVAMPVNPDGSVPTLPGGFPVLSLVRCVGNGMVVVGAFDGPDPLPADFCLELVESG